MSTASIVEGDVRKVIHEIPTGSVQTCVTSPPYWGLRDYEGGPNQIGQEPTPEEYVEQIVGVFSEVKRTLTKDGTLWLNIGDTYVGTGDKGKWHDPKNPRGRNGQKVALNKKVAGLKPKNMIGIPWKVAFALQADGWTLRSDIIWEKPNVMPMPLKDRPISSYEHVFLLSKSRKYFYDFESVMEETSDGKGKRRQRDVWHINTQPFSEAHFAVFPEELVRSCVLAGSKEGDTVLDPFSGSGTTGLVSLKYGRNYVGLENSGEYVELSKRRIKNELGEGTEFVDSLW